MASLIEFITANLSEATFFKELCFMGQKFAVVETGEFELADVFIWLESDGIIIQVKKRHENEPADQAGFDKWFNKKVQSKGSDQIADTLAFFKRHPSVIVKNARGLDFELRQLNAATMHKLIVFGTLADGVAQHHHSKFRISERSGFIHLIQAVDFGNLLQCTVTPGEMLEYLGFREQCVQQWAVANQRTEKWLFGCFVHWSDSGRDPECLDEAEGEATVDALADDTGQSNLRFFFDHLGQWAATTANAKNFARIIIELAHLPRSEARMFKERLVRYLRRTDLPFPDTLYRVLNPKRDCLIVLSVPPRGTVDEVEKRSASILLMAKYAARVSKAMGIFFSSFGNEHVGTTAICVEGPWEQSLEADAAIAEFPILQRPLKAVRARAYSLKTGK